MPRITAFLPHPESGLLNKSLLATATVYVLTAFHHYYGAVVYGTPWRQDVVFIGMPLLFLSYLFQSLYRRFAMRVFLVLYLLFSFVFFGLAIGLFEGGYNHLLKNILFFSGMKVSSWRILFPAPAYELPNNIVFEGTGIFQFFAGLLQIYYLWQLRKVDWRSK